MPNLRHVRLVGALALLVWALLVPGSPRAGELPLPVPTSTIYPGDVIEDQSLLDRPFIAETVTRSSVFLQRRDVVGKIARRTLVQGQPIALNAVREPYLVNLGKMVAVKFESDGLVITGNALALQNGSVGEIVTLRNVDSGIVIRGTVEADGVVRVGVP